MYLSPGAKKCFSGIRVTERGHNQESPKKSTQSGPALGEYNFRFIFDFP